MKFPKQALVASSMLVAITAFAQANLPGAPAVPTPAAPHVSGAAAHEGTFGGRPGAAATPRDAGSISGAGAAVDTRSDAKARADARKGEKGASAAIGGRIDSDVGAGRRIDSSTGVGARMDSAVDTRR